jgi:hypothetical protein
VYVGGALDGSDLHTQKKIKEMSRIVKQLIEQFGTALAIRTYRGQFVHNLRPYWNAPSAAAKQKLLAGKASFQERMQIPIEEWIPVRSRDPEDFSESLL